MTLQKTILATALCALMTAACFPHQKRAAQSAVEPQGARGSAGGSSIVDACSLISQAQADALLETPAKLSTHEANDTHQSSCSYEAVNPTNGVNSFHVTMHQDESPADAKSGQTIKQGIYSNFSIYDYQVLTGIGDAAFLAVNKSPSAQLESGPMASMVARQQILMLTKGSRDIEIMVSYFGKARTTDGVKAFGKALADKL